MKSRILQRKKDRDNYGYAILYRRRYPEYWSTNVIAVFMNMSAYANNENGICFATQETLARDWNMSISTVKRCIQYLLEEKAIAELRTRRNCKEYKILLKVGHCELPEIVIKVGQRELPR